MFQMRMCGLPPLIILKHLVSSVVSLAQLVSLIVALPAELVLILLFLRVGGWVLKLKLMLTQPPTELELELGLSLAILAIMVQNAGFAGLNTV